MIREGYFNLLKNKALRQDFNWVSKRALQYFLIHTSFLIRKPLCGPIIGTFVTDYDCNYHCKICDLPLRGEQIRKKGLNELPTLQLKHLFQEFAALGISGIGFTGGEPLLRSDIFELLKYSKDLSLITHLNTNGFFLNMENAKKLAETGIDSVNISLDGANPATHDAVRGYNGAFDRVINAIDCINAVRKEAAWRVRLKIVAVINDANIDEVADLVRLSIELKTDCIEFIPQQNFTNHPDSRAVNLNEEFLKKIRQAARYLSEVKRKGAKIENSFRLLKLFEKSFKRIKSPITCYAGYNSYAVDCYGEIYPCVPWINWGKSIGNVKEKSLKEFWYSAEYDRIRRDISGCRDCYLNCQAELNLLFNLV